MDRKRKVYELKQAPRRSQGEKQLLSIIIATFKFQEKVQGGYLPRNVHSEDGSRLLSWRVALLPYLGPDELYKTFKLDEPWDSDHNIQLLDQMPEVFQFCSSKRV